MSVPLAASLNGDPLNEKPEEKRKQGKKERKKRKNESPGKGKARTNRERVSHRRFTQTHTAIHHPPPPKTGPSDKPQLRMQPQTQQSSSSCARCGGMDHHHERIAYRFSCFLVPPLASSQAVLFLSSLTLCLSRFSPFRSLAIGSTDA